MIRTQNQSLVIHFDSNEKFRFNENQDLTRPPELNSRKGGGSRARALKQKGDLEALSQYSKGPGMSVKSAVSAQSRKSRGNSAFGPRNRSFMGRIKQNSGNKPQQSIKTTEVVRHMEEFNRIRENVAKLTNPKVQTNENEENPYSDPLNADEAAQEAEIDPQGQNMLLQDAVDIDEQLENVESQAETRLTGKSVIDQLQRELEEEKQARRELQKEVEELKMMS